MRKVIILLLCLVLVSCGTTNKSKSTTKDTSENSFFGVKKKVKEKLIYKKDKSINSFLNKYNEINDPDITSDMVSMKKLEGKDEPSIVDISNEKLGIWIQRKNMFGNKMAVAVLNNSDNVTNDDIKEQFQNYSKVFDDSLTSELPRLNTPYLKSRLLGCLCIRLRSLIFKSPPIARQSLFL